MKFVDAMRLLMCVKPEPKTPKPAKVKKWGVSEHPGTKPRVYLSGHLLGASLRELFQGYWIP